MKIDPFQKIYDFINLGKYDKALSYIFNDKTGRIKSPYTDDLNHAWYVVGDIYFKTKNFQKSLNAFKKSYKYWDDDVEALWAAANCYSELRNFRMAISYYQKAIDKGGLSDELNFNLGNVYFDWGEYELAKKQYSLVSNKNKELFDSAMKNYKLANEK